MEPGGIFTPLKRKAAIAGLTEPALPIQRGISDGANEPVSFTSSAPLLIWSVKVCVPELEVAVGSGVLLGGKGGVLVGTGVNVLVGVFGTTGVFVAGGLGVSVGAVPLAGMRP